MEDTNHKQDRLEYEKRAQQLLQREAARAKKSMTLMTIALVLYVAFFAGAGIFFPLYGVGFIGGLYLRSMVECWHRMYVAYQFAKGQK